MTDSVTYSMAWKRSLPNNKYENITPFFSVSLDVKEGTSIEETKAEAVSLVEGWLEAKIQEIDADLKG